MEKPGMYVALIGVACCTATFAWLCFTAFDRPLGALFMLAITSYIVGYLCGRR